MLLRDYLLLNLGRVTLGEARRWQAEMAARRRLDASRDLLALWQPVADEGLAQIGQMVGFAIFDPHRFEGELSLVRLRDGLSHAVQLALASLGLTTEVLGSEVWLGSTRLARVECKRDDGVLLGEVYLELLTAGEFLLRELPAAQLGNALAHYVERAFGFTESAVHPVAYEESMRPRLTM